VHFAAVSAPPTMAESITCETWLEEEIVNGVHLNFYKKEYKR
jgi:hypothetical protein